MAKWDKEYLKLCKKILEEGVEVQNRTGVNSIKIPSYYFHFENYLECILSFQRPKLYKNP